MSVSEVHEIYREVNKFALVSCFSVSIIMYWSVVGVNYMYVLTVMCAKCSKWWLFNSQSQHTNLILLCSTTRLRVWLFV